MSYSNIPEFAEKKEFSIDDLLEIMAFLRSDNGCPWDREQDHKSIKGNVVEEAFEVVDAINQDTPIKISDELGDLLLQVVFHSQMAAEKSDFDFNTVVNNICRKLISRHTHLFGEDKGAIHSAEKVLDIWDKNKRKETKHESVAESMLEIPRSFPALLRAYKIQKKAARVGFDWSKIEDVAAKVEEEFAEVRNAVINLNDEAKDKSINDCRDELENEIGDLFFAIVNYSRFLDIDPEIALDRANKKFINRFEQVENKAKLSGKEMKEHTLEELDEYWNEAKRSGL